MALMHIVEPLIEDLRNIYVYIIPKNIYDEFMSNGDIYIQLTSTYDVSSDTIVEGHNIKYIDFYSTGNKICYIEQFPKYVNVVSIKDNAVIIYIDNFLIDEQLNFTIVDKF